MTETVAWWAVLALPLVAVVLAAMAASMDAALSARADGRPVGVVELAAPVRETVRLLMKQRRTLRRPDALVWRLGGASVLVVSLLAAVVIPLGGPGDTAVADLSIGVVWWTAFVALLWVGVFLTGWGANSAYPLVAGYRFLAQALAYEMPLAITVITVALAARSLQVGRIVEAQQGLWYVIWMPLGLVIYLITAAALSFWGPFSTPVSVDLAGGVAAELSGVDRLVFHVGRYVALVVAAAFAVPLFFGGGAGPLLPAPLWVLLKTLCVLAFLVWIRWRIPLVRPDRFEEFAWAVLIPATLLQLFVVCAIVLATYDGTGMGM